MKTNTFPRKFLTFLLFTLFLHFFITSPVSANNSSSVSTNSTQNFRGNNFAHIPLKHVSTETFKSFILTQCNTTVSPTLCYDYLSPHAFKVEADLKKLCNISIAVALNATRTASSTILNSQKSKNLTKSSAALLQLCNENVNVAIGQLQNSLIAMGRLNATNKAIETIKIKNWVDSSATKTGYCYGNHKYDPKNVDELIAWTAYEDVFYASAASTFALTFIEKFMH